MPRGLSAALAAVAVTSTLLTASGCGDDGTEQDPRTTAVAEQIQVADSEAKASARTAQTAIETYAVDRNGSYAGATAADLAEIEPTLSEPVEAEAMMVETSAEAYEITVDSSTSGNTFTITRAKSGALAFECEMAGAGGCGSAGTW